MPFDLKWILIYYCVLEFLLLSPLLCQISSFLAKFDLQFSQFDSVGACVWPFLAMFYPIITNMITIIHL